MKHLKDCEMECHNIADGEYFIWQTLTGDNEYYLVKMNIDSKNFAIFINMYKSSNGQILNDNRPNPIESNEKIDDFLRMAYKSGHIKFHSFHLDECLNKLDVLVSTQKYNL